MSRSQFSRAAVRIAILLAVAGCTLAASLPGVAAGQESGAQAEGGQPKAGDAPKPSDWESLVYLPYKNLKQVFEKEGAAVFMPYAQFLKMWDKSHPFDPRVPGKPPVNAVITEIAFTGKIAGDVAQLEASLTVQVLGKPWVELPIQFGDAAIGKMTASDDKVLLQATGNGAYALLFPKAGEHKIKLELSTRVRTSPDGRSLELECPPAGITTFDLTVPAADQTIDVTPVAVVVPQPGDEKSTRIKANIGATKKIAARWRPRLSTAPVMEVLTTVHNTLDVRIADGLVHSHATLAYQVLRGQVDQLRIGVPLEHRILDVTGAGLKSWKAVKEDKMQVVTVDLLGGDSKSISVEVHTERPVPDGAIELVGIDENGVYRGIHALGELRENGVVAVGQSADLSLTVQEQSGLVRIEPAEAPEPLRRPETQFYKYYTPKIRLLAAVKPVEPRLLVDQRTQLVFRDDEVQVVSQAAYTVEKAGVFEFRFKLPEGLTVDRVDCEQMKEFQTPEGEHLLIVVLREKSMGRIAVAITAHRALDPAEKESRPLPLIEPLATARENGVIFVYAPESLELIADEKGVQGAQPTRPEANVPQAVGTSRLASAWSYTRRPEIPVRTERKPTRLTAAVATTINIRQDLTEVTTIVTYLVQFAGIDTFRLAVPEQFAAQVQIESADPAGLPLKQKSRADAAEDGWVTWTIVTQREVTGRVPLRIRYDLKPEQTEKVRTFAVEPVRVLATPGKTADATPITPSGISGELTVLKDRSLSVEAKGEDFEPIDVRELTLLSPEGNLAYRYFKQPEKLATPFKLDLVATQHEIQEVVETVVAQALVEAVLTEDKTVTFRCRYRLKTSERQRLSIELPKDVEILDSFVAGKRVELEKDAAKATAKDRDAFKINVARSTPSDEPFVLALLFRAPFKETPLQGHGGNVLLHLPRLGGVAEQGHAAVAIQQLKVAVWVPRDFVLVGAPDGFTPEQETRLNLTSGAVGFASSTTHLDSWFGDSSGGLFAFTPAGRAYVYSRLGAADAMTAAYWRTNLYAWVISVTVFLAAFVLSWTSWDNRLTVVLVVAFAAAMWSLKDADQTLNVVAAARWGLLAGAVLWFIHALNRPKAQRPAQATYNPADPSTAVPALAAVIPPPNPPKPPEAT
ncbi:MAG: hypothetical protein HY290_25935 [Planctomycetia bacterium]|nr:hypothetical protein [Planctomycetia bacterium]